MTWITFAFLAPALWGLVSLLDTYFVDGIYRDATDGAIVSGLLQGLPWVLVPLGLIDFSYPGHQIGSYAGLAGALFLLSFLAYFRALFVSNDGALMQVLWNLSIIAVPLLTWTFTNETLATEQYIGIVLAFIGMGVFLLGSRLRTRDRHLIGLTMSVAIAALSLSMIMSKRAYELASSTQGGVVTNFASIFLFYCLGSLLLAVILGARRAWLDPVGFSILPSQWQGKFIVASLVAESLSIGGSLASQRAIDLAPSVSYVAVVESLVPVFIMIFSMVAASVLSVAGKRRLATLYAVQFSNPTQKAIGICAIATGIYFVT